MNNLKRISIIARHEFLAIVGKKSFIIMTILIPLIGLACMGLPLLMMQFNKGDIETVAIVDESGKYARVFTDNEEFCFQDITPIGTDGLREFYEQQKNLYAVIVIPAGVDSLHKVTVYSRNAVRMGLQSYITQCLDNALTSTRIESYGIPQLGEIISNSKVEVSLNCIKWDEHGNESQLNADLISLIGMALALLTYMFVMMYGATILSSVIEEKTNRIIEVMVSCCRPIELLLGKIIGVGMTGIVQIAIWCIFLGVISVVFGIGNMISNPELLAESSSAGDFYIDINSVLQSISSINLTEILTCFVLYFIGGYLLYGSMFAAAGSTVDQPNEGSHATMPLTMFLIFALWAGLACANNPNGQLAWWCSMIPFTSPVVMMVRLPYDVAFWEVSLSIAILFGSALGIATLAAKIYRKGILLYGKKFSWKNITMWIK